MSRAARWVLAVALLQAALLGIYFRVEHHRADQADQRLGTAPPQRAHGRMPRLAIVGRDGRHDQLSTRGRRTLVHVWATWCPPCRAELPGLLAVPQQRDVEVVAIALDRSWADVERFLGAGSVAQVVLAQGEVERTLGLRVLPVTFLVEADGERALRFDGARDWTDEAFLRAWLDPPRGDP